MGGKDTSLYFQAGGLPRLEGVGAGAGRLEWKMETKWCFKRPCKAEEPRKLRPRERILGSP